MSAWELTRDAAQKAAIDRSLAFLAGTLIQSAQLPDGTHAAFLLDMSHEIKLGGNAVCLLAFVKYTELTGDRRFLPLMEQLGLGIAHMQDPQTGRFVHVLHHTGLAVKDAFRVIYYDGEAAFGLMRLTVSRKTDAGSRWSKMPSSTLSLRSTRRRTITGSATASTSSPATGPNYATTSSGYGT
ncbi:hypothetical protein [Variovorax paradoxus]|uniref:hypothetical protein n=1 Tax=Variovorax paradoxus TaxID=34073 RepID=UPI000417907F|nr:hypothetical protein [Variovorax paradoxus]